MYITGNFWCMSYALNYILQVCNLEHHCEIWPWIFEQLGICSRHQEQFLSSLTYEKFNRGRKSSSTLFLTDAVEAHLDPHWKWDMLQSLTTEVFVTYGVLFTATISHNMATLFKQKLILVAQVEDCFFFAVQMFGTVILWIFSFMKFYHDASAILKMSYTLATVFITLCCHISYKFD